MAYVKDKRWNDPFEPDDGLRVLICRYRLGASAKPRHEWERALGSVATAAWHVRSLSFTCEC
jgi:hypothetical protein